MDFQTRDSVTSAIMFDSVQQLGPFSSNVSSYFRRPSKIVKPSSRTNSPRNRSRRRMTTTGHFPTRTRSVVDSQRASIPQLSQHKAPSHRPISWHPNTMGDLSYLQIPNQGMDDSMTASPHTATDFYGLVTPMAFPVVDEPQIQELITPLEELSASGQVQSYNYSQDFSMEHWLNQQQPKPQSTFSPYGYSDVDYQAWYQPDQYTNSSLMIAPTSPAYLPMPDFGTSLSNGIGETEPQAEELVGMGLYDSPADVQSSSFLFGSGVGHVKKSLKLEDAFEPAPSTDDDDDEDDCSSEEDGDVDTLGKVGDSLHGQSMSVNTDAAASASFAGFPAYMTGGGNMAVQMW